jgi:hypothetical protein
MRSGVDDPRRGQMPEAVQIEEWFYEKHSSPIEFERDKRSWHLGAQTPVVLSIIQQAKEDLISPEYASSFLQNLRFEAFYKDGEIVVEIPADRLNYKEAGELLKASVRIYVEVIYEGERLDEFTRTWDFGLTETQLLAQSSFVLQIPYIPAERGSYVFELVVEDVMSMTSSKFRSLVRYKY